MAFVRSPSRRPHSTRRHSTDWSSGGDLTIDIGDKSFSVNKSLLVCRSGRIMRHTKDSVPSTVSRISLPAVPGGAEAFEIALKFCYGVNIEITPLNAAMLRCASYYLDMTEEFEENNLELQTEDYLKKTVFPDLSSSVAVLCQCQSLWPVSEEIRLVDRLVDAIAENAYKKQQRIAGASVSDQDDGLITASPIGRAESDEALHSLSKLLDIVDLGFFQRVMSALKSKGLNQAVMVRILIHYAQKSFQEPELRRNEKNIVETIAGLLPAARPRGGDSSAVVVAVPVPFLSSLLKHALAAPASPSAVAELELRIGVQLDQAILEDILIVTPSCDQINHFPGYETESVSRIFSVFLNLGDDCDGSDALGSPEHGSILLVSKLLDSYLAEIAFDSNLSAANFIKLAELIPDHARNSYDGLYRAIDTYLKIHTDISESDRKKLCKTIECQKLSQEACGHAAQNERLPVEMVVQVLYCEHSRLRNAMNSGQSHLIFNSVTGPFPHQSAGSAAISPNDNYASVRRENRELKLEVTRLRMRLTELEKDHIAVKHELVRSHHTKMLRSFGKMFGKLHDVFHPWDHRIESKNGNSEKRSHSHS